MYPGPRPPGQKSPVPIGDGSRWRHIDQFTLLEAGCLWAGIEPLDSLQDLQCSPDATACYRMLTRAVEVGELEADHRNPAPRTVKVAAGGAHASDMLVSRGDLEELATSNGERPLFLFPTSAGSFVAATDEGSSNSSLEASPRNFKRRRERDTESKISIEMKHRTVWREVRAKWPDERKRPPVRQMVKELRGTGYKEETLRKILSKPPPD